MEFEWDEGKRRANIEKHGIDFVDVLTVWLGPVLDPFNERQVAGEFRGVALGTIETSDTIIAVVYTRRDGTRRLISARRARR